MSQVDSFNDEEEIHVPSGAVLRRAWRSVPEFQVGWKPTLLLALFGALGRLVVPLLLRQSIDRGFRDTGVRFGYVAILCAVSAVGLVATSWSTRTAVVRLGTTSERGLAVLRERIVRHILGLSLQQHGDQRRGVLVARATSDVESLSEFFSWSAIAWITNAVVMFVVGIAMLIIDWRLALTTFVMAAPLVPFMRTMQRRLRDSHGQVREHVGSYLGQVSELIGGASLIRAYQAEGLVGEAAIKASDRRRDANVKAGIQSAILGVGNQVFEVAAVITVLAFGLWLGEGGSLSAGTLVSFVFLVSRFLEPLGELSEVVDQTQRAAAGITRVLDLLDMRAEVQEPAHPVPLPSGSLSVSFDDVSFRYASRTADPAVDADNLAANGAGASAPAAGGDPQHATKVEGFAIDHLSLSIAAGTTVAIVGATGSGKSTLARLLVRTTDPEAGAVRLGGVDVRSVSFADLRKRVQLVPQDPFLFDTTIGANLALADDSLDDAGKLALFDDLGIGEWIRSMPSGLETQVGERGGLLSAGERQLVVLARTRACNPDILVLDEATSSVDATTEARLAETIMHLASGRTTVVIAHRLTTAARADRVVVMEAGAIVEDGPPEVLAQTSGGHYARLWSAWQAASQS